MSKLPIKVRKLIQFWKSSILEVNCEFQSIFKKMRISGNLVCLSFHVFLEFSENLSLSFRKIPVKKKPCMVEVEVKDAAKYHQTENSSKLGPIYRLQVRIWMPFIGRYSTFHCSFQLLKRNKYWKVISPTYFNSFLTLQKHWIRVIARETRVFSRIIAKEKNYRGFETLLFRVKILVLK